MNSLPLHEGIEDYREAGLVEVIVRAVELSDVFDREGEPAIPIHHAQGAEIPGDALYKSALRETEEHRPTETNFECSTSSPLPALPVANRCARSSTSQYASLDEKRQPIILLRLTLASTVHSTIRVRHDPRGRVCGHEAAKVASVHCHLARR